MTKGNLGDYDGLTESSFKKYVMGLPMWKTGTTTQGTSANTTPDWLAVDPAHYHNAMETEMRQQMRQREREMKREMERHAMDAFTYSYASSSTGYGHPRATPAGATFRFHRINQKCSFTEGESFAEPLDELRLRTAKWLGRA